MYSVVAGTIGQIHGQLCCAGRDVELSLCGLHQGAFSCGQASVAQAFTGLCMPLCVPSFSVKIACLIGGLKGLTGTTLLKALSKRTVEFFSAQMDGLKCLVALWTCFYTRVSPPLPFYFSPSLSPRSPLHLLVGTTLEVFVPDACRKIIGSVSTGSM